jgi:hypothetical protein
MKIIIVLFSVASSFFAFGQGNVSITHFQNKVKLKKIILPGDLFDSSVFLIGISDSSYNSGVVNLKKLKTPNFICKSYSIKFLNDSVVEAVFRVSGKKRFKRVVSSLSSEFNDFSESECLSKSSSKGNYLRFSEAYFIEFKKIKKNYFFSINSL